MNRLDTLSVWHDDKRVGVLWRGSGERLIGFEYDSEWQAFGHAISHSLPLEKRTWLPEEQTAHRWFGNLLPEEQARAALLKRLAIPDDDFALLEAIGGDCAGALTILPPDQVPTRQRDTTPLALDKLAQWAAFRDRYALMGSEGGDPRPRLSLAGAQDKIPVLLENGELKLPRGATPSSHILKFAVDGRDLIVLNELFLNTLARLTGLACPTTTVGQAEGHPYLLVERYDRAGIGTPELRRVHQEDFCQAMGLSRIDKYQLPNGPRFAQCIATARQACRPSAASLQHLLHWQIFNVLVGNTDGHAKNISLLQDERGQWQVAPAYDLVGTLVLGYHRDLAFSIGDQVNSQQLLPRDWQAFAKECRFSYPFVRREIQALAARVQELLDSDELPQALTAAGLSERGWRRLQQQRQHIQTQCRKAKSW
ncbi:type II toxin-antitoxin system HipA family toxin [Halomonas sp. MCCC 1A11036]|uniref:Type II toxin-antitoxin system HipA family toxin n=1 Tax=Billgrantia zhangzhouensis TaxID=2733481 RepID=A0ABS9ABL1_9GAMM|nr:type II toxin-antitoxin system HipA family toxin [Halomonas zhangzhouensis]MCE8018942.1 type II toxin-antitoxin system HipA family toxin [Halomonas zhangzhouensis]